MTPWEKRKLSRLMLDLLPADGSSIGNIRLLRAFKGEARKKHGYELRDDQCQDIRNHLLTKGQIRKGKGRGGSVRRVLAQGKEKIGQSARLKKLLLKLVPADGSPIGNTRLLQKFKTEAKRKLRCEPSEDEYWDLRNDLLTKGEIEKGRGYGGSVHRIADLEPSAAEEKKKKKIKEPQLYRPFHKFLESTWTKDNNIEPREYVLQNTSTRGKKIGKWTRPDFALIRVKHYHFVPGKVLDLITFEIKATDEYRIEGVFETAAHTRFSHKSYLAIHLPDGRPDNLEFERVEKECARFGIGLIIFSKPEDPSSYEVLQEADR